MRTGGMRGPFKATNRATRKNKNRDGDGTLDFDGFYWIGQRNNQLTSDRIGGIYLG
jgi:hypothetical protein